MWQFKITKLSKLTSWETLFQIQKYFFGVIYCNLRRITSLRGSPLYWFSSKCEWRESVGFFSTRYKSFICIFCSQVWIYQISLIEERREVTDTILAKKKRLYLQFDLYGWVTSHREKINTRIRNEILTDWKISQRLQLWLELVDNQSWFFKVILFSNRKVKLLKALQRTRNTRKHNLPFHNNFHPKKTHHQFHQNILRKNYSSPKETFHNNEKSTLLAAEIKFQDNVKKPQRVQWLSPLD